MESVKDTIKYINKQATMAVLFLDKRFDPNKFYGEKFTKIKDILYVKRENGEEVLENPKSKGVSYGKDLIENAIKIVRLMGYSNIKIWLPSTPSPMIISYDSNNSVIIIAERIKNENT